MTARFTDHVLIPDTHAALPAAATTPEGTLYPCTTHNKLYRNDGAAWQEWAILGDPGTAAALSDHLADSTDAHDASAISYAGSTSLAATNVEAALDELDTEKATAVHTHADLAASGVFHGDWAAAVDEVVATYNFSGGSLPAPFVPDNANGTTLVNNYGAVGGVGITPTPPAKRMALQSNGWGPTAVSFAIGTEHPGADKVRFWMALDSHPSAWIEFRKDGIVQGTRMQDAGDGVVPWEQRTVTVTGATSISWHCQRDYSGGANEGYVAIVEVIDSVAAEYKVHDLVLHNGELWECVVEGTLTQPGTDATWKRVVLDKMEYQGAWNSTATYAVDDLVVLNNATYIATAAHGANESPAPVISQAGTMGETYGIGSSDYGHRRIATGFTVTRAASIKKVGLIGWAAGGVKAGDTVGIAADFGTGQTPTYLAVGTVTLAAAAGSETQVEFATPAALLTGTTYRLVWIASDGASNVQMHYEPSAKTGIVNGFAATRSIVSNGTTSWDSTSGNFLRARLYEESSPTGWAQVAGFAHSHSYAASDHVHAAAAITYAGSTNLAATNVEAALDELDAEKAAVDHSHGGVGALSSVMLKRTTNLSLTDDTVTAVAWDTELWDTDGYHDNATNPSRITIPTGKAGKYLVQGTAQHDATTGVAQVRFHKNGALVTPNGISSTAAGSGGIVCSHSTILDLAVGDYIELHTYQQSGATKNLVATLSSFTVTLLGT